MLINEFTMLSLRKTTRGRNITVLRLLKEKEELCKIKLYNLTEKEIEDLASQLEEIVSINKDASKVYKVNLPDILELLEKFCHG